MILALLIAIPIAFGVLAWYSDRINASLPRRLSFLAMAIDLGLIVLLWAGAVPQEGVWIAEFKVNWVPQLGISLHFAMDGLSLVFTALTAALGLASIVASWTEVKERPGFFHFNLLWALAGIMGTFLSMDLFVFYFFWELMLFPMYFMISVWGHRKRHYASVKFFIFTQAGGLLMLVSILALYFIHGSSTGDYSFDFTDLSRTELSPVVEVLLMLGFLAAFAVKLPILPLHTWLPDAHTEAPAAGSVILAGLLLKTGAYGFIRFMLPLFPGASSLFAPLALVLGAAAVIYGALLAFAQRDIKRLVAYTSVSHMGFVLIGIFAFNGLALNGALMLAVCHGFATGALFMVAGWLQERMDTREMRLMGGLWAAAPMMGAATLFFALASLGAPGLGNFVGEFLVLLGAFRAYEVVASFAATGLVLAAVYSLWIVQRVFHGPYERKAGIKDLNGRELSAMVVMAAIIIWLGVYPQPVLDQLGRMVLAEGNGQITAQSPEDDVFSDFRIEPGIKHPGLLEI